MDPSGLGPLGISNYKTPPDSDPSGFVESRPLRIRTPLTLKNFDPSGLGALSSVKVAFVVFLISAYTSPDTFCVAFMLFELTGKGIGSFPRPLRIEVKALI